MINIKYISTYLPKTYLNEKSLKPKLGKNYKKIIQYTGFKKIFFLSKKIENKEFIFKSLRNFFDKNKINLKEIDSIIFSSHSRDTEMPIMASAIQKKFELKKNMLGYDLPNSCSGFTNGLIHAHSFINSKTVKNVLLICCDFHSKKISKSNYNLLPVIGDGLSCIYITKENKNKFLCDFGIQGENSEILKIDKNQLAMNGMKVFEFAINAVPLTVNRILKKYKKKPSSIDFVVLHQPNKNINEHLIKKLPFLNKKFLINYNFGNLSSASIPANISKNFPNKIIKNKNFLFVGFGSGLSWSSVILKLRNTKIANVKFL